MKEVVTELVFSRDEPTVHKCGDFFIVYIRRDIQLTILHSERLKRISDMFSDRIDDLIIPDINSDWELPDSPHSKTIKYRGIPLVYSATRFGIMKAIILARDKPATYENLCLHGWGKGVRMIYVDPDVIGDAIYHINFFHKTNGIPVFVHFNQEQAYFGSSLSGKTEQSAKKKLKKKKAPHAVSPVISPESEKTAN